jgi:hypothetical protein
MAFNVWRATGFDKYAKGDYERNINKQQPTKNTPAQGRRKKRQGATSGECRGSAICYDFLRQYSYKDGAESIILLVCGTEGMKFSAANSSGYKENKNWRPLVLPINNFFGQ